MEPLNTGIWLSERSKLSLIDHWRYLKGRPVVIALYQLYRTHFLLVKWNQFGGDYFLCYRRLWSCLLVTVLFPLAVLSYWTRMCGVRIILECSLLWLDPSCNAFAMFYQHQTSSVLSPETLDWRSCPFCHRPDFMSELIPFLAIFLHLKFILLLGTCTSWVGRY